MARFVTLSGSYGNAEVKASTIDPGLADRLTGILWVDDAGGSLHIKQSADGVNYDLDTVVAGVADTGVAISVEVVAPFIEVRFINGATPTTVRCAVRFTSAGPR